MVAVLLYFVLDNIYNLFLLQKTTSYFDAIIWSFDVFNIQHIVMYKRKTSSTCHIPHSILNISTFDYIKKMLSMLYRPPLSQWVNSTCTNQSGQMILWLYDNLPHNTMCFHHCKLHNLCRMSEAVLGKIIPFFFLIEIGNLHLRLFSVMENICKHRVSS